MMPSSDLTVGAAIMVEGPLPGGQRIGKQRAHVASRWVDDRGRDMARIRMDSDGYEETYLASLLAGACEPAPPLVAATVEVGADGVITSKLGVGVIR